MGSEDEQVVAKRNDLRERIKANLLAAAAAGVDLEGTLKELFKTFFANVLVNVKVWGWLMDNEGNQRLR